MHKSFILFVSFLFVGSTYAADIIAGGDRDVHGCIGSAGYSWSAPMKECIRTWERYDLSVNSVNTGDKKLDTLIQRKIDRIVKDFRKESESQIAELSLTGKTNFSLDISPVIENSGSIISVRLNTYTFLGWAHGTAVDYTWNYDVKKKALVSLLRVITKKDLQTISKNISKSLQKAFTESDIWWLNEWLSPAKLSNYQNFSLQTDSNWKIIWITFYFADYQVGPHAFGMPVVRVSLPDMTASVLE